MKDAAINCFSDILKTVKNPAVHERHMISKVMIICNLLQVNPATLKRNLEKGHSRWGCHES